MVDGKEYLGDLDVVSAMRKNLDEMATMMCNLAREGVYDYMLDAGLDENSLVPFSMGEITKLIADSEKVAGMIDRMRTISKQRDHWGIAVMSGLFRAQLRRVGYASAKEILEAKADRRRGAKKIFGDQEATDD